jgi:hypothetical protein
MATFTLINTIGYDAVTAMVDLGVVGWVATGTTALTAVFIVIRITHFSKEIPEMIEKIDAWLKDIEKDLEAEIEKIAKVEHDKRKFEDVLTITSNFSAAKSMQEELDESEKDNIARIRLDLAVIVGIIVTGILFYAATLPSYADIGVLAFLAAYFMGMFWFIGIYSFYLSYSLILRMGRTIRKKKSHS